MLPQYRKQNKKTNEKTNNISYIYITYPKQTVNTEGIPKHNTQLTYMHYTITNVAQRMK